MDPRRPGGPPPRRNQTVLLAADSLEPGNGGICRVARLVARVLDQELAAGALPAADAVVLNDAAPAPFERLPVRTARASRPAFVANVWTASLSHSHYIYDSVSMARAHPRVRPLRRPNMLYVHGFEVWENVRPDHLAAARRADVLVANSHYTRDRAARHNPDFARAAVCWLATEDDEPAALRRAPTGPPTVTIIGRMENYKGHRELIECWPRVTAAVPDARLLVVGRGPCMTDLQSLASRSPAAARIEFAGFVAEAQMPGVWARTHVFAMPSRGEGFGLVYIEAMRHAIPVIASMNDAAHEITLDAETGYNVNLDGNGALEDRIIHLLRNPDEAERLGRNGLRRWADHFTYTAFARRFTPHLHKFLEL